MKNLLKEISIIDLRYAGKIFKITPNKRGEFQEKAWRVFLHLNPEWAFRAMKLDQTEIVRGFERRGYVWKKSWIPNNYAAEKNGEELFTFTNGEGGLVRAIPPLCRDPSEDVRNNFEEIKNPEYTDIVSIEYTDCNMDHPSQQEKLIHLCKEYVNIVHRLLK